MEAEGPLLDCSDSDEDDEDEEMVGGQAASAFTLRAPGGFKGYVRATFSCSLSMGNVFTCLRHQQYRTHTGRPPPPPSRCRRTCLWTTTMTFNFEYITY